MNQTIDTMDAKLQGFRDNIIDINVYRQIIEDHQELCVRTELMKEISEVLYKELNEVMANNEELKSKINVLTTTTDQMNQMIDTMDTELQRIGEQEKVNDLTTVMTGNQKLNTKVTELNSTNEQMKEVNEEKQKLVNTDKECEQLKDNLQKVNDELIAAKDTIESMNNKIRILTNEIESINNNYNMKCNETDQLKIQNNQLVDQIAEQEVKWRKRTEQLMTDNKQLMDKQKKFNANKEMEINGYEKEISDLMNRLNIEEMSFDFERKTKERYVKENENYMKEKNKYCREIGFLENQLKFMSDNSIGAEDIKHGFRGNQSNNTLKEIQNISYRRNDVSINQWKDNSIRSDNVSAIVDNIYIANKRSNQNSKLLKTITTPTKAMKRAINLRKTWTPSKRQLIR
ncbi:putative leucine-rich repeat-containing protein DDB_G0290503 [Oppia nitens]|uniref:putative leucine-rich repeat-containing protein DDB_G0290503 n=1 Tax=Oppia nitens TaxID=1686743 RepID=UPI0023DB5EC0|nr:putative leucine-rich repeat-containing protein DDB_G0290503 [Oppia nitens]